MRAEIRFDSFRAHQKTDAARRSLELSGSARFSGAFLRLTPAKEDQTGTVWLREKQPIASHFESTFQFQLTHLSPDLGGADGFAFVLQNAGPKARGGHGSAGGFGVADGNYSHQAGIPWSLAVFFDTWQNSNEGDTSDNAITVRLNGRPAAMRWPAERLASATTLRVQLKDGRVHTARVVFDRPVLRVFLDEGDEPALQTTVDLSLVADAEGKAWVGFTASTGWGYEDHDILNWSFRSQPEPSLVTSDISFPMAACLPDHNLCTPEEPVVSQAGHRFHVILPGNQVWGVRLPNPRGSPAVVTKAHGVVCWDVPKRGSQGCSGPTGSGGTAGPGFLEPTKSPGSLVQMTKDSATWFSVNGQTGPRFQDNEGFFEFDVDIP